MLRLREGPTRQQTLLKVAEIYQKVHIPVFLDRDKFHMIPTSLFAIITGKLVHK